MQWFPKKSPFERLRPYHLYTTRALVGLLNLGDLAVQLLVDNPFSKICLASFKIRFWWPMGSEFRGEYPKEGLFNVINNPPMNPHLKLGCLLAHGCSVLLQHVSKNLK